MGDPLRKRIGILGGGQLGKMLCQAGSRLGLELHILESDPHCPAASVCPSLTVGSLTRPDDVLSFGREMDIVTIEIENVAVEALEELEREGISVFPPSSAMKVIRDKGLQKEFYQNYAFPTAPYMFFDDADAVRKAVDAGEVTFPFVQKSRRDGYDGKGVHVVRAATDLAALLPGACLVETMVDIDREIAVIVARNAAGDTVAFPAVEMQFHPTANLVEFLFSPSSVSHEIKETATFLAKKLATDLQMVGLLAVEMFLDKQGKLYINEVAPRPHNSGHHTIEACDISQYEMHLRALLNLPLCDPHQHRPAVMVNVLGAEGYEGLAKYEGIDACLEIPGIFPHLYGKKFTKPYRKMGHVTTVGQTMEEAVHKARFVQSTLKVIA